MTGRRTLLVGLGPIVADEAGVAGTIVVVP
jgi:hypothetical protein